MTDYSLLPHSEIRLHRLDPPWVSCLEIELSVLRLDLIHPLISGNKWFKLKYNLEEALKEKKDTILTFGGNRSNHIAATAAACRWMKLRSIGIIRGDNQENPTLKRAKLQGMELHFISRDQYRRKEEASFLKELQRKFSFPYFIPEGGNNELGVKGAMEMVKGDEFSKFTHICCPVGTGSTLAGIIRSAKSHQEVLGFSTLPKSQTQALTIKHYLKDYPSHAKWHIFSSYSFGGFAKKTVGLMEFIQEMEEECQLPLDFVYTGKMVWGVRDLLRQDFFPTGSKILIIHTGGLQGMEG